MKTREQIYGQEAASILRDITMYRMLTKEQLLRLYPGKQNKVQNLLSFLTKRCFREFTSSAFSFPPLRQVKTR